MLSVKHVDDYVITHKGDIILSGKGPKLLNERLLSSCRVRSLDLSEGFQGEPDSNGYCKSLSAFLKYLVAKSPKYSSTLEALHGADFVCGRGTLEKIASASVGAKLGQENDWTMICEIWNDVIFMKQALSEKDTKEKETSEKLGMYMGGRFGKYMCQSEGQNNYDYRTVMVSTLCDKKLRDPVKVMYSGEIGAVDLNGNFVEFHTYKDVPGKGKYWPSKSLSWWLQTKLLNVNHLMIGVKDGTMLRDVRRIQATELRNKHWNPSDCVSELHESLLHIKDILDIYTACSVTCKDGFLSYEALCEEASIVPEFFKKHFTDVEVVSSLGDSSSLDDSF